MVAIVSRLESGLGCTFVVWVGEVTLDEWREHFEGLLADPAFPPGRSWLVDARDADLDLFDRDAIAEMGARMNDAADRLGGMRVAVVPNGGWGKANKLLGQELTVARLTAIQFTRFETACLWLGVPVDEAEAIVEYLRTRASS